MTMPCERTRAVNRTREFLFDLMNPKATPRVPSEIRDRAYSCIKHYPGEYYMELSQEHLPEVWGDPDE